MTPMLTADHARRIELQQMMASARTEEDRSSILAELMEIARRLGGSSALARWRREITEGLRTKVAPQDDLWAAACRELNDLEYERDYGAPQRAYVLRLRSRHP